MRTPECKGTFPLVEELSDGDLHNSYFVSYDVDALFTNVPVDEVVELILNTHFPKGTSRKDFRFNGFKRLEFKRMLEYCLIKVSKRVLQNLKIMVYFGNSLSE